MILFLALITVKRKHISELRAIRAYILVGVVLLIGLYIVAIGAGLAPTFAKLAELTRKPPTPMKEYRPPAKEMNNDVAKMIAEELRSEDLVQLQRTLPELRKFPPTGIEESHRQRVASALVLLLDHKNAETQAASAFALATWGDPEVVPKLIELATDEKRELLVRRRSIFALGELGDDRAIEPVGTLMTTVVGGQAMDTLKKFGAKSEPIGLKLLESPQQHVHIIGCDLLAVVGTKASLPKLDEMAESDHWQTKAKAAAAAKAVRERHASPAT